MVSLLLAVLLSSVTSEQQLHQNYADAYKHSVAEDKPLMVVVGAPGAPPATSSRIRLSVRWLKVASWTGSAWP